MSDIYVNWSGNGYAYVDNSHPIESTTITLYCIPDTGETLEDVTARSQYGWAIALATQEIQTFPYDISWGDMYIEVVFSGSTPPPTSEWLWAILFKKKRRYF